MAHQHDLDEHWPPSHLVDYLRAAPADGPRLSVIPRPRSAEKAPDELAYLDWEGMIPRMAAARSVQIGYGGRPEADLPVLGEFSADYVAEIAIGVASGASWDGIKLLISLVVRALRQQLEPAQQRGEQVEARIGLARLTDQGIDGLVVEAADADEAGRQAERVIRTWGEVRGSQGESPGTGR